MTMRTSWIALALLVGACGRPRGAANEPAPMIGTLGLVEPVDASRRPPDAHVADGDAANPRDAALPRDASAPPLDARRLPDAAVAAPTDARRPIDATLPRRDPGPRADAALLRDASATPRTVQ